MKRFLQAALAFVIGVGIMAVFVLSRQLGDDGSSRRPDLSSYCIAEYGAEARTYLNRPSVFGWQCVTRPDPEAEAVAIDINAVCRAQFGSGYMADYDDEGWPYAWLCVGD